MNSSSLSAAIDLGSNSFRLTLAQINTTALSTHSNPITLLHTLHETVRLAAGLTPNQLLSQTTIDKALQALMHFRQYLAQTQPKNIYAIATSALRKALNAEAFLQPAEQLLNSPINVISGLEEARLIYSGSLYQRASDQKKRLVIDIGGGSTELIVGQDNEPDLINSIDIGCISHTYQFFPAGDIDTARMSQAEIAAQQAFAHLADSYRVASWVHTFASSGIACALAKVLTAYQLNSIDTVTPHTPAPYLTRLGLTRLKELVLKSKHINCLQLQGLDIERTPIFIGGLTIMLGIMRAFNIEVIETIGDVLPFGIFKHLHQLETADHNLIHV